jgi:hypothetical protein
LAAAGAGPVIYWCDNGAFRDDGAAVQVADAPLPPRDRFGAQWRTALPRATVTALLEADLLVIEGRIDTGGIVIQTEDDRRAANKYDRQIVDLVITGSRDFAQTTETIIGRLKEAQTMPGKPTTKRRSNDRAVRLLVGGQEVKLNGFVRDVFKETIVGIVRALGTEDEESEIQLTISETAE